MQENRTIYEILLQENKKQEVADLVSFNEKTESFGAGSVQERKP